MNPQLERLFHSIRRGIEANVRTALRNMEVPRQKDFNTLKDRIDDLRKTDLAVLTKKLDEVKKTLTKVEAFKPYIAAFEAASHAYSGKKKPATKRKSKPKTKKRTSKKRVAKKTRS